ncbi:ABC transporter permease [Neptunicoccus cionae]|uniref:Spermidine/putrescine ABC transporter permease n=1 Tax=Neptunicoccus cionae TaxID=2035344 RepID=A0A916VPU5_9RHOB|nr:ABC transporter permease [Amylibacter cionae]GGA17069.1 spermidine/putrescine ABC transporter permease [Amylibacter cionae]
MSGFAKWRRSEEASGWLLVSPTLVYSILLLAAPLAMVIALSFWTQDYLDLDKTFTLKNYIEAWSEPIYQTLMARSLKISAFVTALTILLAFPVAYYVSFYVPQKRKPLWIFLITIPFWTSYLMRIFLWKVILGYNGVVNGSLLGLGVIEQPLSFILYNQNAVVVTLAHAWVPFAILPIFVALEKIDRSLLEAAEDLGDGPLRRFIRVTLPLAMPGVVAATVIVFIPTIGDYVTPRLVGGPNGLMISNMIELQFKKANNAPLGAALALSAMFLVSVVSLVFVWMNRKYLVGQK